jgi:hypothetical protein
MSIISPSASGSSPASPKRCREALRDNEPTQSEDRYALAMESINESVYDWDVESGAVSRPPAQHVGPSGSRGDPRQGASREVHQPSGQAA